MERIIFRAGIKKHKGSLAGIMILLFLSALSLCTVFTVYLQGNRYIHEEIERIGYGTITAWVSDVPDIDELTDSLQNQDGVEQVTVQDLIFSDYEGNGVESDSEGQLISWQAENNQYRFFKEDISGYEDAPAEISQGEIYVSPSMKSILNLDIGDTITFAIARSGMDASFTVAGYYEDPVMGSSMIGMKGFLISQSAYEQIVQTIETEGADALARNGAMLHITADRDSGLTVSSLNQRLNEDTSLSQYAEFIHSAETMESFMGILQNAFCGLLAAFAAVLLGVTFVVLGHSISNIIEQDWKNLGILKTVGMTGRELVRLQESQYILSVLTGLVTGILGAIPAAGALSRMIVTTSGVLIPTGLPVLPAFGMFAGLLLILTGFTAIRLRSIHFISPMEAIRGEKQTEWMETQEKGSRKRLEKGYWMVTAKGLMLSLAFRQLLSGKRRYISACLVAILLVFFASLTGRMNDWLGPDGQGMMDAFNPADLDLGIQVLGELQWEEMERIVRNYSEITDSYELAMPSVSVNGTNYTANVITEPERFHISQGQTSRTADEVVLTETVAYDLGVDVGDRVTIRGDTGTKEFTVSGIYHCANDMGANLGMSREGYLSIGSDDPGIWCRHYFLADTSQKQVITEALENAYGGDVHVHENTWPGLFGIISAMHLMLIFMYGMSAVFVGIVTVMTGTKILDAEQKDMGIYRAIGCHSKSLRLMFALRFGIVAVAGAVIGTILAAGLTDLLVSAVMRFAGISNFASNPSFVTIVIPGLAVTTMFFVFAYLASGKLRYEDMAVLTAD
ncbi:MAG: FtsX-like permease family protein [Eubacteriales bacterium]|nr:FtsX-like permease family protein [Eubacteriales bacterium]